MSREAQRAAISSVSSAPVKYYEESEAPPAPAGVDGELAVLSDPAVRRILEAEPLEALEAAGKYSRAKWKIQIWFKSDRSSRAPIAFTLSFWESGKRLHGGGDESAFVCRRHADAPKPVRPPFLAATASPFKQEATVDGCGQVIPGDLAVGGQVVCPGCGITWPTEHIADSLFYRLPIERAVDVVAAWFRKLDGDCDLYLKYRPEDVRSKMMAQTFGLREAIKNKGLVIYPLRNILKEMAHGATLESRIRAVMLA